MKLSKPARKKLLYCVPLIFALILCSWLFGWFVGNIDVVDFGADEVDQLRLSCTLFGYDAAIITEKDDIQAAIEAVNSFHHTGKAVKGFLTEGIGLGGSVLYNFDFQLENGTNHQVVLSSNNGEQSLSNMEVAYWVSHPNKKLFTDTCRGSLEFFFELHQKYTLDN